MSVLQTCPATGVTFRADRLPKASTATCLSDPFFPCTPSYQRFPMQIDMSCCDPVTIDVDGKVTENSDVEMTDGSQTIDKGDLNLNQGNDYIKSGNLDVSQGNGGGNAWVQNTLTVGRNAQGALGGNNQDGNFVVRGNQIITGSVKFDYGLTDDAGSEDGSGGFAGSGSNCTNGSTGPGSNDFDMAKNSFWICTADNTWHRVLTDHDKN
ncbi:hypothetical protein GOB93_13150 [Acetobacter musti]|uniref:Uncharacterized protein n=1 Tax=Acetobacter musti TaxID=864732 RepID=A0ABX0JRY1_9PROT|nr:hypothetical protein [Acetobacter musti]NHN85579.1 hypothetical protein [Acetobacter musti]